MEPLQPPAGIAVHESEHAGERELTLVVPWFQGMGVVGFFGALVMAVPAAVFWIGGEELGLAALISIPPLGLLYWSLAATLNRTTITLGRGLTSRHAPIPWPHGFEAALDRVERVELRERRSVRGGRVARVQYDAVAIVSGVPQRLAPGISDRARLGYIVAKLDETLRAMRASEAPPEASAPDAVAPAPTRR